MRKELFNQFESSFGIKRLIFLDGGAPRLELTPDQQSAAAEALGALNAKGQEIRDEGEAQDRVDASRTEVTKKGEGFTAFAKRFWRETFKPKEAPVGVQAISAWQKQLQNAKTSQERQQVLNSVADQAFEDAVRANQETGNWQSFVKNYGLSLAHDSSNRGMASAVLLKVNDFNGGDEIARALDYAESEYNARHRKPVQVVASNRER